MLTALSLSVPDVLSYGYMMDVPGWGCDVFSLALHFDDEKPDEMQKEGNE